MTARSWNSSTATAERPCCRPISFCSVSCFTEMAVEDMAKAPPSTMAMGVLAPMSRAMATVPRVVNSTWAPPSTNTDLRITQKRGAENSNPKVNSRNTTPNCAKRRVSALSVMSPRPWGPTRKPVSR